LLSEINRAMSLLVRAESLAIALGLSAEFGELQERVEKLRDRLDKAA
jgi:hypothetical protein